MATPKKPKGEDLEFQMAFYEGIVRENPNFVEALIALGEIYTKKGRYEKGLAIDRKLAKLRPENPIIHYNLACSFSLLGDITSSFRAIECAIELGYSDFVFMDHDPDLSNLKRDQRFSELMRKVKKPPLHSQDAK